MECSETTLGKRIDENIILLNERCQILQKKYDIYKKWYDVLNIMIIVISTFLSISEALRNKLESIQNATLLFVFDFLPLCMSSVITCTVAIIKLQKYQENMEFMLITKEKVILTVSRLKEIKEIIWAKNGNEKDFENIMHSYMQEVYPLYNSCLVDLDRNIKYSEIQRYTLDKDKKTRSIVDILSSIECCCVKPKQLTVNNIV